MQSLLSSLRCSELQRMAAVSSAALARALTTGATACSCFACSAVHSTHSRLPRTVQQPALLGRSCTLPCCLQLTHSMAEAASQQHAVALVVFALIRAAEDSSPGKGSDGESDCMLLCLSAAHERHGRLPCAAQQQLRVLPRIQQLECGSGWSL